MPWQLISSVYVYVRTIRTLRGPCPEPEQKHLNFEGLVEYTPQVRFDATRHIVGNWPLDRARKVWHI